MPPKSKGRRPAHQNKKAFTSNPHSTRTLMINALPNEGLCQKCHDIIEWRKRYHKFKPLTTPRRCQRCGEKSIVHAYHVICTACSRKDGVCAKCCEPRAILTPVVTPEERRQQQEDVVLLLNTMSLRQKKTYYRVMDREHPELLPDDGYDDCCEGPARRKKSKGRGCTCGHCDQCLGRAGADGDDDDDDDFGSDDADDGDDDGDKEKKEEKGTSGKGEEEECGADGGGGCPKDEEGQEEGESDDADVADGESEGEDEEE